MQKKCLILFSILLLLFPVSSFAATFTLPSSVTTIETESFSNTTSVDEIIVPEGTKRIDSHAFSGSSVRRLTLPSTITYIADDALDGCNIKEIICPPGSYAEHYCFEHNLLDQVPITYPTKSISVVCPWGAGGSSDATLRALSLCIEKELGYVLTIDNTTGDNGIIGHQTLADSNPDGHTIGLITSELSAYQHLGTSTLSFEDYTPLCMYSSEAAAIIVDTQWAEENEIINLDDFIQYCQTHPGEVQMGSLTSGSIWHIASGYLIDAADIELQITAYSNVPSALNASHAIVAPLSQARPWLNFSCICLGTMDTQRSSQFPDIPTCKEQGYDFVFGSFLGLALPKHVDARIHHILINACARAVTDVDFTRFMNNNGLNISYLDADDFTEFLAQRHEIVKNALDHLDL